VAAIGEFRFSYLPAERRAARWGMYWHGYGKWLLALAALVCLVGVLLALPHTGRDLGVFLAVFGVVYGALVPAWVYLRGDRRNQFNTGEFHVVADDETGLHVKGAVIEQTVAWSAYREFVADDRFLYLYTSRARAQVLPRRAGPGVEALREWLERRGLLTTS
jgi:hypothetical protein